MEARLNASSRALERLNEALYDFEALDADIEALSRYYGSEEWFSDLAAYERGELPREIRCGVLSEDLVYDLLCGIKELEERLRERYAANG